MNRQIYVDYFPRDDETVIVLPYDTDIDQAPGSISYRYHVEIIQALDRLDLRWCEQWMDKGIGTGYKCKNRSYTFLTDKANMYFIAHCDFGYGAAVRLIEDVRAIVSVHYEDVPKLAVMRAGPLGVDCLL